jgi:DNA-binding CsgD family transcriptional regulator
VTDAFRNKEIFLENWADTTDSTDKVTRKMQIRTFTLPSLGFGLYWSWLWIMFQTPIINSDTADSQQTTWTRIASLTALAIVLLVLFFVTRNEARGLSITKLCQVLVICTGACATVGTVLASLQGVVFDDSLVLTSFISWIAIGVGAACGACLWAAIVSSFHNATKRAMIIGASAFIATTIFLVVTFLDAVMAVPLLFLLPLGSAFIATLRKRDFEHISTIRSVQIQNAPFIRIVLAFGVFSFAFGMMWGTSLKLDNIPANRVAFTVVLLCMGALLVYLHFRTISNATALYRIVPPLILATVSLMPFFYGQEQILLGALGGGCYMLFEIFMMLVLFDYIARLNLIAFPAFCIARLATTVGLALGWAAAHFFSESLIHDVFAIQILASVLVLVLALANVFLIDEKALFLASIFYQKGTGGDSTHLQVASTLESFDSLDTRCAAVASRFALTAREEEVLALLARGKTARHIQEELVVSNSTVKAHRNNIYKKMNIHSHQELIHLIEKMR